MKFFQTLLLCLGLACTLSLAGEYAKDDDVLVRALQDEMQRSLEELQIEDEPKAYFIAYTVNEVDTRVVQSILGTTADVSHSTNRNLTVSLRVGDRRLDNTNYAGSGGGPFAGMLGGGAGGGVSFPLTDSYDELRRVIWMNTDVAYKAAVSSLSGKKTALEQQRGLERADDFNEEEPFEYISDRTEPMSIETDRLATFANELSAVLKGHPEIQTSSTIVSFVTSTKTYTDSDGNFHRLVSSMCSVQSVATAQADDGAMVHDRFSVLASSCEELFENVGEIKQQHETLIASIQEFMGAEHLRSYTGPVLITEEASASVFAQILGSRVGASPKPVSEQGGVDMFGGLQNPFLDKIGVRVLPRFLSVVNDPTISEYEGVPLLGSYVVDDEGMPSRRTELIKDGQLQTLLTTRSPVRDFNKSTGSSRLGAPSPGNLFISSNETMTEEELKQELLVWVEDSGNTFGIVIKRFTDMESLVAGASFEGLQSLMVSLMSGGITLLPTARAYKVNLDGSEVPIRSLSVSSLSDSQLKDIVAVADTSRAYNVPPPLSSSTIMSSIVGAALGATAGTPTRVGVVSPSLLIEELTLQSGDPSNPRLPIVAHPESE